MTSPKVTTGEVAPDTTLTTLDGDVVHLRQAWRDGPALIIFLRHLG